jgi:hypothetical protein
LFSKSFPVFILLFLFQAVISFVGIWIDVILRGLLSLLFLNKSLNAAIRYRFCMKNMRGNICVSLVCIFYHWMSWYPPKWWANYVFLLLDFYFATESNAKKLVEFFQAVLWIRDHLFRILLFRLFGSESNSEQVFYSVIF